MLLVKKCVIVNTIVECCISWGRALFVSIIGRSIADKYCKSGYCWRVLAETPTVHQINFAVTWSLSINFVYFVFMPLHQHGEIFAIYLDSIFIYPSLIIPKQFIWGLLYVSLMTTVVGSVYFTSLPLAQGRKRYYTWTLHKLRKSDQNTKWASHILGSCVGY